MDQKQFKMKSIQPVNPSELYISPELEEIQGLMPISLEDRERLKRDIESSGEIRDAIKVYYDKNGDCLILGGFNRWQIALELGFSFVPVEIIDLPTNKRRELAIMDNLARRHLTQAQKSRIIEELLKGDPAQSNRTISGKVGVDHKTVGTIRSKLESSGEIPQLEKRTGADGKERKSVPVKESRNFKDIEEVYDFSSKRPVSKRDKKIESEIKKSIDNYKRTLSKVEYEGFSNELMNWLRK